MRQPLFASITAITAALSVANARADAFVDIGIHASHLEADVATFARVTTTETGVHLGAGLRRDLARGSIGARLEFDNVDGDLLLAVRAFDWSRNLSDRFAVTAFAGAARLDLATPAYGYYYGAGMRLKELVAGWDLGIDLRYGDKLARDNLLPTDPQGGKNDNFYDLSSVAVYLSRRF
ncbi:MAG TPA: hypothetical protein VM692_10630 [Gammaproteobacteria bacterium]|nr:hypothetical protein [Gammaproteobacteria bacterium]